MNEMYRKRPNSLGTIASSISTPDIVNPNIQFEDLPTPVGKPPYHLSLSQILTTEEINRIHESGAISFHIVGDTGGTKKPENQKIVEMAMNMILNIKIKQRFLHFFIISVMLYTNSEKRVNITHNFMSHISITRLQYLQYLEIKMVLLENQDQMLF